MGIVLQTTCPYTPEQNGLCERMNRTLVEKARCMLFDAQLSKMFWAEATNTAVYLHNRTVVEKENTTIAVTEKENVNETSKGTDQPSSVEDDTLTSHEKSTNDSDSEYAPNTGDLTLQEALTRNEKEYWQKALKEEFQWFEENQAWELVDASNSGCVVQCKWVLKKKCDVDGKVLYRARLVAKCFTQRHGVDYNETFSPVVRYSTLRLLFALTVKLDFKTTHLDVKTAFLNGHLEDDDFMQKPDCFVKSCFLKLKKGYLWIKAIFKNVV
ncbi:unnamed protein product [Euphydryas editha]|uniref:Integrase catalytic domain-containing protein n=1 Tax=Euphydryas editha TaxID=104508 RepID=A0AAU9VFD0_EUPED|nr:unnamed protein product [Euphydryas editha]